MSNSSRVVVLYEDQRNSTGAKPFGLHELLVALVADKLEQEFFPLRKRIQGIPRKGNVQVMNDLSDADNIGRGSWVLAFPDEDRIREHAEVGLPESATHLEVVTRILAVTGTSTRRSVTLLVRNMESVIHAAAKCDAALSPATVGRALKKKPNERDIVLNHVAHAERSVRECIADGVPSLLELRDRVICALDNPRGW